MIGVLDLNGKLKLVPADTTVTVVPVSRGGTGLSAVSPGDVPYGSGGSALNVLSRVTSGVRLLSNQGVSSAPSWLDPDGLSVGFVPRASYRKSVRTFSLAGATTMTNVLPFGSTLGITGTASSVVDSDGAWVRWTSSASIGSTAGFRPYTAVAGWVSPQQQPLWVCRFRTGTITSVRIWLVLANSATTFPFSNADDQHAVSYIGMRYSTAAPDSGWMTAYSDGTTQTIGSQIAAIAANTIYRTSIAIGASTTTVSISNDDGSIVSSQTFTTPSISTTPLMPFLTLTALAASARAIDCASCYGEWN